MSDKYDELVKAAKEAYEMLVEVSILLDGLHPAGVAVMDNLRDALDGIKS